MLQLHTKELDISRTCKLLAKYPVKAKITERSITLESDISDELLSSLCSIITVGTVQNYIGEQLDPTLPVTEDLVIETTAQELLPKQLEQGRSSIPQTDNRYDLIYSTVRRGEVYLCDFGEAYGSEQSYTRYAIVVQNDTGNYHSPTTIVIPCTTKLKNILPVHYSFYFSKENMLDFDSCHVSDKRNIALCEHIMTVDKTRLRKFLGTMNANFMNILQEKIAISLDFVPNKNGSITSTTATTSQTDVATQTASLTTFNVDKNLSIVQIQLLTFVDVLKLLEISKLGKSDDVKAEKILELFGFDMGKNGVSYLLKAILISPKSTYFNLETLCENLSIEDTTVSKDEIKRLIVARVKEQFQFKKSPTIEFIRLVNIFLTNKEI